MTKELFSQVGKSFLHFRFEFLLLLDQGAQVVHLRFVGFGAMSVSDVRATMQRLGIGKEIDW